MESNRYTELAVTSNFSFLRGASQPEELMATAAELNLSGLGICDRNSVAGVVRAYSFRRENELTLRYHPGARLVFVDGTPDFLAFPRDRAGWGGCAACSHAATDARRKAIAFFIWRICWSTWKGSSWW